VQQFNTNQRKELNESNIMKKAASIVLVLLMVTSMSSCKLFRGKNKCDTCPSWKAEVKQIEPVKEKV